MIGSKTSIILKFKMLKFEKIKSGTVVTSQNNRLLHKKINYASDLGAEPSVQLCIHIFCHGFQNVLGFIML